MLDFRVETFLAVRRHMNFTKAARELNITQPAVSHWLADIEDLVGAPLFVRGRQLKTTPAGEVLRRQRERGQAKQAAEDAA